MVNNLSTTNSILHHFIAEIRDKEIQKDRMRFRRNLERIGEIMAYEISKTLLYHKREVTTPLGTVQIPLVERQPVLVTVLRAGLPMHQGFLNYFDQGENGFISAYRHHTENGGFEVRVEYLAAPGIENKVLILCDPMLATGSSILLTHQALLKQHGTPSHTHIATIIASTDGINYLQSNLPKNTTIWCAAIDDELNSQSYIIPGLGDAGDLAFGDKI